ncbi:c-type cytochrome [Paraburkholderia sp. A1RO-5L]|uniref:c-type cytochrome n=1 Tax=unclassified Paraburkholderia TaxID=2615204 RepID=UPI003B80CCAF
MKLKSHAKNDTATPVAALALALALATTSVHAQNGPGPSGLALAQQQNCMSCHSVTRTFMGPSLHHVAAKYAGKPDAQSYLARKILEGSNGVWGSVPMPANTQLTSAQAASLANWILTLK